MIGNNPSFCWKYLLKKKIPIIRWLKTDAPEVTWLIDIAVMAVVGCLIGWFTNFLAVKMLFRPFRPWKIPLTKFEIQGLIPKRRAEIAASIGETIENELISVKELVGGLVEGENKQELIRAIRIKILSVIDEKIPSIVPGGIRQAILSKLKGTLNREIADFMDHSMEDMIETSVRKVNISNMVEERLNSFELDQVERIILDVSGRELKYIELLGGVLGFVIGIMQGLLLLLF